MEQTLPIGNVVPRPVALRPLALPSEHGGWGILIEPIAIGLLVAGSWSGALIAIAAVFAFLARHPLKLALQDALRGKSYPRTHYCRLLAATYLLGAALALGGGVAIGGAGVLIPFAFAAPLALVQVLYDARNRSRELFPELSGAAAMSSVAAAIAIGCGMHIAPALGLAGIVLARSLPSIVFVRALLRGGSAWPAIAMHVAAVLAMALFAPPLATLAMIVLLLRAIWSLTHGPVAAKTIGWREIAYGALTVALVVTSIRVG